MNALSHYHISVQVNVGQSRPWRHLVVAEFVFLYRRLRSVGTLQRHLLISGTEVTVASSSHRLEPLVDDLTCFFLDGAYRFDIDRL